MKLTELQGTLTLLDAARAAGLHRAQGRESLVSAKTDDLADAKRELKRLTRNRDNAGEGKEPLMTPKAERVRVADLLDANLRRAEAEKLASLSQISDRTETLKNLLGQVRALEFRPEHVDLYQERRKRGEGTRRKKVVGETSIRRELEILRLPVCGGAASRGKARRLRNNRCFSKSF